MPALRNTILFLIFWWGSLFSEAQDTVLLFQQAGWDSAYNMEAYARYQVDSTSSKTPEQVIQAPFIADTNFYASIRSRYGYQPITAWMRWIIHNPSAHDEQVQLIFSRMSFLCLYVNDESGFHLIKHNRAFFSRGSKNERRSFYFTVAGGATVKAYAQMNNAYQNFARQYPIIIRPPEFKLVVKDLLYENRYYIYTDVIFMAIVFFITLHSLAQYIFNRRKEFLLYAFYSGCVLAFFIFKFDEAYYNDVFFSSLPYIHKYGNNPLSYLMFLGYYRFVRHFIDFKRIAPKFYRVIIITERILLSSIVADILLSQWNFYPAKIMLFNAVRIYLVVMGFTGIVILLATRKTLPRFIAVGSGCFVIGALLAMLFSWWLEGPYNGRFDPIILMQAGIVLELICFTLGLSYKTGLIEKEKMAAQQQLIVQLEENKGLQEELTTKLEARVHEQTDHILEQQRQLEIEKEQQLTIAFTKKITEIELQLLKSQLNPHFYFNTLNNLYGLAMIAPKKAPDAILKLSDIMEYIIYDCRHDKVPVEKELRFINSYVELEKLRYDNSTKISLAISGDPADKFISPLLLIQFIENAFKHGLEQYKDNSFLSIKIVIENDHLLYESVNSLSDSPASSSGGVGLANVKKRLEMIYPGKHTLYIDAGNSQYSVQLNIQLH